ncbi:MAG TPA: ArsR family transcriptional regulator [bacterium]|nr:ArsR family transcriptional regulator [bacterium]
MEKLVKIFKALGDKNRLRIVKILQQRSLCVCEITSILELATSTVSAHLSILKEADIIFDHKTGKWVDYHLNIGSNNIFISGLLPLILDWLNDDEQVKSDREKLKTTDRIELCKA